MKVMRMAIRLAFRTVEGFRMMNPNTNKKETFNQVH